MTKTGSQLVADETRHEDTKPTLLTVAPEIRVAVYGYLFNNVVLRRVSLYAASQRSE